MEFIRGCSLFRDHWISSLISWSQLGTTTWRKNKKLKPLSFILKLRQTTDNNFYISTSMVIPSCHIPPWSYTLQLIRTWAYNFNPGSTPKTQKPFSKEVHYWYADSVLETNQQPDAVYRLEISVKMAGVRQDWATTLPCDDRLHLPMTVTF